MKRLIIFCLALVLCFSFAVQAAALDGQVVYAENAKKFIFMPGSNESPTDLFPNFKDVMPGDIIEQSIFVKNDASNKCKVKIYMRALGAHEGSEEFLSQLHLTVVKKTDTMLFDAPADQAAQLSDWVYLGTLYSGGECELLVKLDVPVTLDTQFKNYIGFLDWEFAVEELPIESTDPIPPTGDNSMIFLWSGLMVMSFALLMVLLLSAKKKKNETN